MCKALRVIQTYDPLNDLADRWPGWRIETISDLRADIAEILLPKRKTCLVSRALYELDPARMVAHLVAHLDLHKIGGPFSQAQEQEADMLADLRLDREGSRV